MSSPSKSENSTTERLTSDEVMNKIRLAVDRLDGVAHKTPVLTSRTLNQRVTEAGLDLNNDPGQADEAQPGLRVFLKSEQFQRVGAFKFRGAFNALSALTPAQREQGVITYSSGNHAQAMALASRLLGIHVTVVMPNNAPAAKLAATRDYGAEVVTFDPDVSTREAIAAALPHAADALLIPPFDHYDVIAGQGTAALELHEQVARSERAPLDVLLVPVGGGGLLAGSAVATRAVSEHTRVIGVEPANADDAARSMKAGRIIRLDRVNTIADGTRTPAVGERNFALIQELVSDIITVSEQAIADAVRFLFERLNIVVEPSGALGVAALLSEAVHSPVLKEQLQLRLASATDGSTAQCARVGVILSGGNVDSELFGDIINNRFSDSTV